MDFDLLKLFDHHGDNVFASSQQRVLTYQQCLQHIKYLAALLYARGIFGQKVMLSCRHTLDNQLLFLALLHTNDVVLVHPDHAESFLASMIKQHGITAVIADRFTHLPAKTLLSQDFIGTLEKDLKLGDGWQPWYPGTLSLFTSGTTDLPKTTTLYHEEILQYGQLMLRHFSLEPTDCFYNMTPFYHGFGLTRLISVIVSGSSMYVPDVMKQKDFLKDINKQSCTWVSMIPRMVRIANRSRTVLWDGFKFATCSAAMVSKDTLDNFQSVTTKPIYVEYGCTEASVISSNTAKDNKPASMGKTWPDQCQIVNQHVMVRPAYNMDRGWVDTGDIGYIDSDGFLWLHGRSKEVIKKNGRTIFPFEIECVFDNVPGIQEVAAFCIDAMTDHENIGLAYVGNHNREYVESLCRQLLPSSCQPALIAQLHEMPLTCGKLSRRQLQHYVTSQQ